MQSGTLLEQGRRTRGRGFSRLAPVNLLEVGAERQSPDRESFKRPGFKIYAQISSAALHSREKAEALRDAPEPCLSSGWELIMSKEKESAAVPGRRRAPPPSVTVL